MRATPSRSGNDGDDLYQPGEGNLPIVSQTTTQQTTNDNHDGGHIDFDFSNCSAQSPSREVFDVLHNGACYLVAADGELLKEVPIPAW